MLNSSRTSAEMKEQVGSHDAPSQPGSPAHCGIGIRDAQDVLMDEVHDLPIERRLESICDVADNLLAKMDGLFADGRVKLDCPLNRIRRCLRAPNHLDQRNQVWRVKRMPDDATFGMLTGRLHHAHREPG